MKRLARVFSALCLALILWGVWLVLAPDLIPRRPDAPVVTVPQRPETRPERPQAALQGPVDRILIEKSARRMTVFRDGESLKTYRIGLGFEPDGSKLRQGDGRTPEGVFRIDRRNDASAYHLSLGIDYPRPEYRDRARAAGVDPGGDIFIHGQPNQRPDGEVLAGDWTAGCIAVSDAEIRELFAAAQIGTEVEIRP
ncbi:L,D-transpeptidase [uncultured Paracoccus sp.]|uniref:L,D-transpeptidase family protein n=1 Tax=uncultured Paracoccus sp. TaxID=189685 RepID=UPI00261B1E9F|nr:L,D-transpeptidase [uncultured Paracoccus sp.]